VNNDAVVKQALVQKMKSPKSLEVIYAADSLEKLDPEFFCQALIPLFHHEDPDIQKFALKKIKEYPTDQAIPSLKKLLEETDADELKIEVLKALTHIRRARQNCYWNFLITHNLSFRKKPWPHCSAAVT
jgi:hypothetical protein